MRAYSMDLRERIVAAAAAGACRAAVARQFQVSRATVARYVRRAQVGQLAPGTSPGRPAQIGTNEAAALQAQLAAHPDATLAEHVEYWRWEQGVTVSVATMHRAIGRVDWTRKKRRFRRA